MSAIDGSPGRKAPRAARAEASVWIVRLHSEARTPELEAGLREWLAADPENSRQFERVSDVWDIGGTVTANELPRMRASAPKARWALGAALATICAIAIGVAYWWWAAPVYVTHHGEQRLVRLDDGSRVYLNSDSRLRIDFGAVERRVQLEQGEGLFEVAKDPARPFIVRAGNRQVTALGTTFVVRIEPDRTSVMLIEGKVSVSSVSGSESINSGGARSNPQSNRQEPRDGSTLMPAAPNKSSANQTFTLTPGKRLTLSEHAPPTLDSPRVEALTAWRRGEVLLESTPLVEAVAEMNRYDKRQIILDDRELAAMQVSGIYRTGDSTGFARAVAELRGLEVTETTDEIHLQRPRARRPAPR